MKPFRFAKRFIGGLNKDANVNDLPPNDFIDGYDIVDRSTQVENEDGFLQPAPNTVLAYDLGEAEATAKVYRVTMDLTGLANCNLLFNVDLKGVNSSTLSIAYTLGQNAATTLANIQTGMAGEVITPITVSGFTLVFDIYFTSLSYSDYYLSVTNSLGGVYSTVPTIDAVSVEKAGIFYPSRFENINNDGQVFATTNTKKPVTLEAEIYQTGFGLQLVFLDDPLLDDGEEVFVSPISGVSNTISGYGIVEKSLITPNTYTILGSPVAVVGLLGVSSVVRYARTLSIIGYAQKNEIADVWNYTELLRSNKLNFRLYKQIEGSLDIASNGLIYDWTDFLNKLKRLIYKGNIIEWGFLALYNSEGLYNLDTIEEESNLQLGANTSKVTISVGSQTGAKKESCYTVFVRFKTSEGAYSTYSQASNVFWLHSTQIKDHNYGLNSGCSLEVLIEQINPDLFESVQVGIIEFTTSSWVGYSLPEIQINGQTEITVVDNGFDTESYLSFNDAAVLLEQLPFVFENAKSLISYIGYKVAANVNLFQQYDLNDWAQDIVLTVVRRFVQIGSLAFYGLAENTDSTILRGINENERCSSDWLSYMPYDKYRFCIIIFWKNGSPPSTYWIEDLSFDPTDTGLDDSIVSEGAGLFSTIQYYVEARDIDMDYILPNGKKLSDEVKDIRFGRALCNPQVLTTGFGMNVYNDGSTDYVSGFDDGGNTQTDTKLALYSADYQNTQQQFNFLDGDVLKTRLTQEQATTTTGTSNKGVAFVGGYVSASLSLGIDELYNVENQSSNPLALYKYTNSGDDIYIRNSAIVLLDGSVDTQPPIIPTGQTFYYVRPYPAGVAYPENPSQTRFFVIPQDNWYDEATHDSSTVYSLYGGDAFPTLSAYKVAENTSDTQENNAMFTYWHFNRTNTGLRSGRFPFYTLTDYLESPYLVDPTFEGDKYTYDACFTPRYLFQNKNGFNANLVQYLKQFSSIYYSGKGFGADNSAGNRSWLPLDFKPLETIYGSITHIAVLFGLNSENILMIWQERRFSAQYFNNTANIKSNSGELLIGNGAILGRQGQDLSEFGCEHKWTIKKGKSPSGKDVAYWTCFRKGTIMRYGADGTGSIVADISTLINTQTLLALQNTYAPDDEPAFFRGCHAVWDNQRMEYILTIRLYPKIIDYNVNAQIGEFKASPTLTWGFEQFPVIYESLINNNSDVPPSINWKTISGYDSEYFEVLTIVWNERDNKFKSFRTYNPKIYGKFNNTFVSSHPVQGNLIFEHNTKDNEALYYCTINETPVTATTNPDLYRIEGAAIESYFPSPFTVNERSKYVVQINGKNYEVIGTGTDYLQMASVDDDDIMPQVTIEDFSFYLCNTQDPYIQGVASSKGQIYFHFGQKSTQADSSLKRTEYEAGNDSAGTTITRSFTNKVEEEYYNGRQEVQIKQDTTNSPNDNTVGKNNVEGMWVKIKQIWRWGKKNKLYDTFIEALGTEKIKK